MTCPPSSGHHMLCLMLMLQRTLQMPQLPPSAFATHPSMLQQCTQDAESLSYNVLSTSSALTTLVLLQFADAEHIPVAPQQGPITVHNAGERLFLRCERQVSFDPLP